MKTMKTAQTAQDCPKYDCLKVVLGVRIFSYSHAQEVYGVLRSAGVSRALHFETAPTLTQTLYAKITSTNHSVALAMSYSSLEMIRLP